MAMACLNLSFREKTSGKNNVATIAPHPIPFLAARLSKAASYFKERTMRLVAIALVFLSATQLTAR